MALPFSAKAPKGQALDYIFCCQFEFAKQVPITQQKDAASNAKHSRDQIYQNKSGRVILNAVNVII
jgi:hypothetical protein